jgi:hypothetical protein
MHAQTRMHAQTVLTKSQRKTRESSNGRKLLELIRTSEESGKVFDTAEMGGKAAENEKKQL